MECIKEYYIKERKFGEQLKINNEVLDYWKEILKGVDLSVFQQIYGEDLEKILFKNCEEIICNEEIEKMLKIQSAYEKWKLHFNNEITQIEKGVYFQPFYNRFVSFAINVLNNKVDNLPKELIRSYANAILEKIGSVSLRVLIQELHICKASDLLHGDIQVQYKEYCDKYLSNSEYIEEILDIYPVMRRLVFEAILLLSDRYQEFIFRFRKDKNVIKEKFSVTDEDLHTATFKSDTSDSHNRGETVFIINLCNENKIVYKARSLKAEIYLQRVLSYIEGGLCYKLKKISIIDCGNYGWEEFIVAEECHQESEIKRFYYRFGSLIFVSYILNANDLHEENVIANGEYPVIIDGETILDNWKLPKKMNAGERISDILRNSVLLSGLLPKMSYIKKGKGIDMSALRGQGGQEFPFQIPKVVDAFTANMRLEYVNPHKSEKNNLVKLNGMHCTPDKYVKEIIDGFIDAYNYVCEHRIELCELIKQFGDLEVRHIVQDTQKYGMTLHLSYHPDFMQDGIHRELFLCSLYKNALLTSKPCEIIASEVEDMLHMDIPYFKINVNETILRNGAGKEIKDYFSSSSMEMVRNKIMQLCVDDREQQEMYIRVLLDNADKTQEQQSSKFEFKSTLTIISSEIHKENCVKAVKKIADYYLKKAVWGSDRKDVNWIVTTLVGNNDDFSWDIRTLKVYLYEGLSGIAIFFTALNRYFQNSVYQEISEGISKILFEYTDDLLASSEVDGDSGLFSGEAGLVYAYALLFQLTEEQRYLNYAVYHAKILTKLTGHDTKYDIMYGNAGAILALLDMYELTQKNEYLDEAFRASRVLVEAQKENGGWQSNPNMCPLAGMSHGVSGIIYALAKLWSYKKDNTILSAIKKGLIFENSLFVQEYGNWKDERYYKGEKVSESNQYTAAWCHGAPGILLSRLRIWNWMDGEIADIVMKDIKRSVDAVQDSCRGANNCLCHGNMGNTEIMIEYCKVISDKKMQERSELLRKNLIEKISQDENLGIKPFYGFQSLGFMNGLAGIGYSIMRELDKVLPCVMAVDLR